MKLPCFYMFLCTNTCILKYKQCRRCAAAPRSHTKTKTRTQDWTHSRRFQAFDARPKLLFNEVAHSQSLPSCLMQNLRRSFQLKPFFWIRMEWSRGSGNDTMQFFVFFAWFWLSTCLLAVLFHATASCMTNQQISKWNKYACNLTNAFTKASLWNIANKASCLVQGIDIHWKQPIVSWWK